jgi:hypothetical protein
VGIVDKAASDRMLIIEGNKGGAVGLRYLLINDRYIRGYATPAYEEEDEDDMKEKIVVIVKGRKMEGYLIDGSAYIPARKGMQAYDGKADVVWDDKARQVTVK